MGISWLALRFLTPQLPSLLGARPSQHPELSFLKTSQRLSGSAAGPRRTSPVTQAVAAPSPRHTPPRGSFRTADSLYARDLPLSSVVTTLSSVGCAQRARPPLDVAPWVLPQPPEPPGGGRAPQGHHPVPLGEQAKGLSGLWGPEQMGPGMVSGGLEPHKGPVSRRRRDCEGKRTETPLISFSLSQAGGRTEQPHARLSTLAPLPLPLTTDDRGALHLSPPGS